MGLAGTMVRARCLELLRPTPHPRRLLSTSQNQTVKVSGRRSKAASISGFRGLISQRPVRASAAPDARGRTSSAAVLRDGRAAVSGFLVAGRVHPRRVSRRFHRHGKKVRLWNTAGMIFGKSYTGGSVDYTLRAPSGGSWQTGSNDRGTPQSNEWDAVLDKNSGYIKNWNSMLSWGQDSDSAWGGGYHLPPDLKFVLWLALTTISSMRSWPM